MTALHFAFTEPGPQHWIHWEDLAVGTRFQTSSRTVTEADVVAFAALTADHNRIHVDAEYAGTSPYGQRIAHGLLVVSMMAGLVTRTIANQLLEPTLLGLLETRARYLQPTLIGDTLRVEVEVIERRATSKPDRGLVVFRRRAINQRGETSTEVDNTMIVQRRSPA